MRRFRGIVLLVSVLATLIGGGLTAAPADARDNGPVVACRLELWIDGDGNVHLIECYY